MNTMNMASWSNYPDLSDEQLSRRILDLTLEQKIITGIPGIPTKHNQSKVNMLAKEIIRLEIEQHARTIVDEPEVTEATPQPAPADDLASLKAENAALKALLRKTETALNSIYDEADYMIQDGSDSDSVLMRSYFRRIVYEADAAQAEIARFMDTLRENKKAQS